MDLRKLVSTKILDVIVQNVGTPHTGIVMQLLVWSELF